LGEKKKGWHTAEEQKGGLHKVRLGKRIARPIEKTYIKQHAKVVWVKGAAKKSSNVRKTKKGKQRRRRRRRKKKITLKKKGEKKDERKRKGRVERGTRNAGFGPPARTTLRTNCKQGQKTHAHNWENHGRKNGENEKTRLKGGRLKKKHRAKGITLQGEKKARMERVVAVARRSSISPEAARRGRKSKKPQSEKKRGGDFGMEGERSKWRNGKKTNEVGTLNERRLSGTHRLPGKKRNGGRLPR